MTAGKEAEGCREHKTGFRRNHLADESPLFASELET
jgi:hypothetical protein